MQNIDNPDQKIEATTEKVDVPQKPDSFQKDRETLKRGLFEKEFEEHQKDIEALEIIDEEIRDPKIPRFGVGSYNEKNRDYYEKVINHYLISRDYDFMGLGKKNNEESIRSFTKELVDLYKEFKVKPPNEFEIPVVIEPFEEYTIKTPRRRTGIQYSAHPDSLINRFRNGNKLILEKLRSGLKQRYGLE